MDRGARIGLCATTLHVQVAATIARGLLKRTFLEWQRLAEQRWWKNQLVMREREVALLEAKIRGYEKRPIQVWPRLSGLLGCRRLFRPGSLSVQQKASTFYQRPLWLLLLCAPVPTFVSYQR